MDKANSELEIKRLEKEILDLKSQLFEGKVMFITPALVELSELQFTPTSNFEELEYHARELLKKSRGKKKRACERLINHCQTARQLTQEILYKERELDRHKQITKA